jgi:hypothetical protein
MVESTTIESMYKLRQEAVIVFGPVYLGQPNEVDTTHVLA